MTIAPCLVHFDDKSKTELYTDASNTAFSGVLVQVYGEDRRPVDYYSRYVKKNDANWQMYLKEFGALMTSIKHFQMFLIGKPFKVYLDNHAVSYLHSIKLSQDSSRVSRFVTFLNQFDSSVLRIKSAQNLSDFYQDYDVYQRHVLRAIHYIKFCQCSFDSQKTTQCDEFPL